MRARVVRKTVDRWFWGKVLGDLGFGLEQVFYGVLVFTTRKESSYGGWRHARVRRNNARFASTAGHIGVGGLWDFAFVLARKLEDEREVGEDDEPSPKWSEGATEKRRRKGEGHGEGRLLGERAIGS